MKIHEVLESVLDTNILSIQIDMNLMDLKYKIEEKILQGQGSEIQIKALLNLAQDQNDDSWFEGMHTFFSTIFLI